MAPCRPTVEPMVFVYFMCTVLSGNLATDLLLYKACDGDVHGRAPEPGTRCADEATAQRAISAINAWKLTLLGTVPLAVTFFAGPRSDRHGCRRRPLMLLALSGQIVTDLLNAYCSWHWALSPATTAALQVPALMATGGTGMMCFAAFAFLADHTDAAVRTVRFGLAVASLIVGTTVGQAVFGVVLDQFGFVGSFGLCAAAGVAALGLAVWLVPETTTATTQGWREKLTFGQDVVRTLNPKIFIDCARVVFLERIDYKTHILLLVLVAAPITSCVFEGETSLMYLFLRNKFHWDEITFSVYIACTMSVMMTGTFLTLWIMSGKLKMNDSLISIIASVFDTIVAVSFLLASEAWQLYLIPPLQLFRGTALSITASISSKCVESHELGMINSVRLIVESLTKGAILPLYNIVYNKTLDTFPSAFFIISIVFTVPLIGCFCVTYYLSKRQKPINLLTKCQTTVANLENCPVIEIKRNMYENTSKMVF